MLQDPEVLSPSTESLLRGPKRSFLKAGRGWFYMLWCHVAIVLCCTFAGFQRSLSPMTPRQQTSAPPSYRRTHHTSVRAATRTSKLNRIRPFAATAECARAEQLVGTRAAHGTQRSAPNCSLRRNVRFPTERSLTYLGRNGTGACTADFVFCAALGRSSLRA